MDLVINSSVKNKEVSLIWVKKKVEEILKSLKKMDKSISINFVGEDKIKSLNRIYRKKDKVTDVLSFCAQEGQKMPHSNDLGDIFICVPQVKRQAKKYDFSYKYELSRMMVHGILHLIGHDHIKKTEANKMFEIQEQILKKVCK